MLEYMYYIYSEILQSYSNIKLRFYVMIFEDTCKGKKQHQDS